MLEDRYMRAWKLPRDDIKKVDVSVGKRSTRNHWTLFRFNDGNKELCEVNPAILKVALRFNLPVERLERRIVSYAEKIKAHAGYTCIDGKFIHRWIVVAALRGIIRYEITMTRRSGPSLELTEGTSERKKT